MPKIFEIFQHFIIMAIVIVFCFLLFLIMLVRFRAVIPKTGFILQMLHNAFAVLTPIHTLKKIENKNIVNTLIIVEDF